MIMIIAGIVVIMVGRGRGCINSHDEVEGLDEEGLVGVVVLHRFVVVMVVVVVVMPIVVMALDVAWNLVDHCHRPCFGASDRVAVAVVDVLLQKTPLRYHTAPF